MKAKSPVATTAGIASGRAMRMKVWKRVQPSTVADSNSSFGILRKNTERMRTVKGRAFAAWTKMIAALVPRSPAAWIIM